MRKRFGQHFLVDDYTVERIVDLINPGPADHILEIGPGGGVLTDGLVASGARVVAVEIDRDLIKNLSVRFAQAANFKLVNEDILAFDLATLEQESPSWKVVGNLPYNISTPLIMHLLEHAELATMMTFMLQLEVAQRLAAAIGSGAYGRLSVMAQRRATIRHCLDVPAACFKPPPKVESAVVQLEPRSRVSSPQAESAIAELVRISFSQRRKTLGRSLRGVLDKDALVACAVDPRARPETLSGGDFERLAEALLKSREEA